MFVVQIKKRKKERGIIVVVILIRMLSKIQERFIRKKPESVAELNTVAEFDRSLNEVK